MKRWDAFISHASEDKHDVVTPLAEALAAGGLRIWVDEQVLRPGDSLREKIDQGLAESRFGIVVLSPNFLAKRWPARELNGLMALEEGGLKIILPVWHQIEKQSLSAYSPILADRLACDTRSGIQFIAKQLTEVIVDPASGSPSADAPTPARRFIHLLDSGPSNSEVRRFLESHPSIVERAVGGKLAGSNTTLDGLLVDLSIARVEGSSQSYHWTMLLLGDASQHPFPNGANPSEEVRTRFEQLSALRSKAPRMLRELRSSLENFNSSFRGVVVAGRRAMLSEQDREWLRAFNDEQFGLTLRTYDWLVEAALQVHA
ncbi:MAG: toll/interleukin-1 receptor domain-containing protein [Gemmatimonadaceae bacterium]